MAFQAGVGVSRQFQDSHNAGHDAATKALEKMGAERADIALVFASTQYDQEAMLKGVRSALGDTPVVGCTSAGSILATGVVEQAVSVLVMKSDVGVFSPVKVSGLAKDMRAAGREYGTQIKAQDPTAQIGLMFSDSLAGNGTELVRGVLEVTGSDFRVSGGAAGDDMNFKQTYQYFNDEVLTDSLVGFGIAGNMAIAAGADHGWESIGNPRIVTKAEGTKLFELDGKPAFSIYEEYFGATAEQFKKALSFEAVSYPLGMKAKDVEQIMIRVPLKVEDDGSIILGAEAVVGSEMYLMVGNVDGVLKAAENTVQSLVDTLGSGGTRVAFVSDCIARKILLGERGGEEIALLHSIAGADTEIFGFYSYGQIAPLKNPARDIHTSDPGFYEQSISIVLFGEK